MTGGDAVTVDRKNREAVTCRLPVRFVVLANEVPDLSDGSAAVASRFVVLRTTRGHLGAEDLGLKDRLAAELPGVLLWALDGWRRLRDRGRFVQPASGEEALDDVRALASPVREFAAECCAAGPGRSVPCQMLYDAWRRWCAARGVDKPGPLAAFARDLKAALPGVRTSRPRAGGGQVRVFDGIALTHAP